MKINELAASERPFEKCIDHGTGMLSDAELLAIILRSGSKDENVLETAQRILTAHPIHEGIVGLNYLSVQELMCIKGVGRVKAVQMKCIAELSVRMASAKARPKIKLSSPESIADYFMERTKYLDKEVTYLLMFDAKYYLLKEVMLSTGSVDQAVLSPREIFKLALVHQAMYIIIVHNHPTGNPEPSRQDIAITRQVAAAGKTLGIRLSDHIVIGNNCFVSMAARGLIYDEI